MERVNPDIVKIGLWNLKDFFEDFRKDIRVILHDICAKG